MSGLAERGESVEPGDQVEVGARRGAAADGPSGDASTGADDAGEDRALGSAGTVTGDEVGGAQPDGAGEDRALGSAGTVTGDEVGGAQPDDAGEDRALGSAGTSTAEETGAQPDDAGEDRALGRAGTSTAEETGAQADAAGEDRALGSAEVETGAQPDDAADDHAEESERGAPARRWRRWLLRAAVAAVALLVALHLLVKVAVAPALRAAAGAVGLTLEVERTAVSLLGGDVELTGLVARPAAGGEPVARLEHLRLDVATPRLLLGQVVVRRLEVDGVDLALERDPTGAWSVRGLTVPAADADDEPTPDASADDAAKGPAALPDLSWLRVDAVAVRRVRLRLADPTVSPPLEVEASADVRLAGLDGSGRSGPAALEVDATATAAPGRPLAPRALERLRLDGTLLVSPLAVRWRLATRVDRLAASELAPLLQPLGIQPLGGAIDARALLEGGVGPAMATPGALSASCTLEGVRVAHDGRPAVTLARVVAGIDAVGAHGLELGQVLLENLDAEVTRTRTGALRVAGLELSGPPPSARATPSPAAPRAGSSALLPLLVLRSVDVRGARLTLHDEAAGTTVALGLQDLSLAALHLGPDAPPQPLELRLALSLPGIADSLQLDGTASLAHRRWTFDVAAVARGVSNAALRPYLAQVGVEDLLDAGELTFRAAGAAEVTGEALRLDAALRDLRLFDGPRELLGADEVLLEGARLTPAFGPPRDVAVARVAVRRP
ncbi:MAG: DUF748 domain-containing protein, partial [Planctomycetes bacterium]|nr:DUF748 domain-containing protein [Planctomycetota bacterium]